MQQLTRRGPSDVCVTTRCPERGTDLVHPAPPPGVAAATAGRAPPGETGAVTDACLDDRGGGVAPDQGSLSGQGAARTGSARLAGPSGRTSGNTVFPTSPLETELVQALGKVVGEVAGADPREVELFLREPRLQFTIESLALQFSRWQARRSAPGDAPPP